ncbi:MAG: prolipoprotein diacylglyceryl transferase [Acidobacteria bacterium]|nr:prolipoprotein diacylglyceryl transferase [Acidobacteriota bacterium]
MCDGEENATVTLLASLPSPSSNAIHIGAFQLRAYGLMIAIGVIAAVAIARRRWAATGGNPDDISAIATWGVPAGLVGARLYHVITDYRTFEGHWGDAVKVWQGGLGIPGGLVVGVGVGAWAARRRGMSLPAVLDTIAPAIPVAQAIGRLGNWFNQELFGRPSGLPWALHIDADHRPEGYERFATYHPTFLYEALWNLALAGLLVWLGHRHRLRRGQLFCLYVAGYGLGRLWVEALRIDFASRILGVRVNIWVSGAAIIGGLVAFVVTGRRQRHRVEDQAASGPSSPSSSPSPEVSTD